MDVFSSSRKLAEAVREKLNPEHPCFVKKMTRSTAFFMPLPEWLHPNLPEKDSVIALQDEEGRRYYTKYLINHKYLGNGWKTFAEVHNIEEGDALIFQLVAPTRFKVYIIKTSMSDELGAALTLMDLKADTNDIVGSSRQPGDA